MFDHLLNMNLVLSKLYGKNTGVSFDLQMLTEKELIVKLLKEVEEICKESIEFCN